MSYIQVASSLLPGKTNTPLDARSVVATVADISAIELPYVGLLVYCKADGKYYKITSLKAKTIGALSVANAAVDSYEEFNPGGNAIDTLTLTIPAPPSEGDSLHVEIHRKNSGEWNVALDSETDYAKVLYFDGMDFASCTSAGIPGMFQGNACCVSVGSALNQGDLCRYKWKVAGDSTGTQDGDWQGFVWPAATVCNGGVAYIDGIASGGMSSGGDEPISSGGTSSGGDEPISSGGTSSGGDEPISSGGTSSITYEPLGSSGYAIYDSADNMLSSGAVLTNGNISSGYRLEVYSDGQAINPLLNGGTAVVFNKGSAFSADVTKGMLVISGGNADSTTVEYHGSLCVYSGVANSTTVSGGTLVVAIDGTLNSTTMHYGGKLTVSSGGVANSTTVIAGTLVVAIDGTLNSTTMHYGALTVSSGGVANSTTISGSTLTVSSSGVASAVTMDGDGKLTVSSGGVAHNISYAWGTSLRFSCGAMANAQTWCRNSNNYGISGYVSSGGTANNVTLGESYNLTVASGGTLNSATMSSSGLAYICGVANDVRVQVGEINVMGAGTANNIFASAGGKVHIYTYGLASGVTIDNGGRMTISPDGVASAVTVSSGGTLMVSSGGMAFDVTSMTDAVIISSAGAYITYA